MAHSSDCRLKIIEQAPNNETIAARVKRTMSKDQEFHSKNLEKNEEHRKRETQSSTEPATVEGEGSAGASRA